MKKLGTLTYDEFAREHILVSAAERDLQVAIQATLDVASMILADQTTTLPKEYKDFFPALAEIGVLPADFAQKLVGMAKFRNILVHLYIDVDLRRLYRYLQENLSDFEAFAHYVSEWITTHNED
ncbi:MAG: type VII toxin-antitoxin system HepT family RNase toxin [Anaerolineae bacterium]